MVCATEDITHTRQFKKSFRLSFSICLSTAKLLLFTCEVKPMGGVFIRSLQVENKAVNRGGFYLSLVILCVLQCTDDLYCNVSPTSLIFDQNMIHGEKLSFIPAADKFK
jgi:hypothetical protein